MSQKGPVTCSVGLCWGWIVTGEETDSKQGQNKNLFNHSHTKYNVVKLVLCI